MSSRAHCPCCGAAVAGPAHFEHPGVPRLLNVLAASREEAIAAPLGRLELVECASCGTVFNRAFSGVAYGPDYFVDATLSGRYRAQLDDVSDRLDERISHRRALSIVDVGAGQGSFLKHLAARLGSRLACGRGFDPAFRPASASLPENVEVTSSLLDATSARTITSPVDIVATRHVVEHLQDPVGFLASFRRHIAPPFTLLVETPNVGHTLAHGLLHDFCYEHCSMASEAGLRATLEAAGYDSIEVGTAFDGEYLLAFANATPGGEQKRGDAGANRAAFAGSLAELGDRFAREHRQHLTRTRARGTQAIWGAAGKGALFALLVDPDRELVDFAIDIHPSKHGSYMPGTGHRVVSPDDAFAAGVRTVWVANPTYAAEITALCAASRQGVDVECVGNRASSFPS